MNLSKVKHDAIINLAYLNHFKAFIKLTLTLCCMSFFSSVLEGQPNIGFYCLQTHRRGAHRKSF